MERLRAVDEEVVFDQGVASPADEDGPPDLVEEIWADTIFMVVLFLSRLGRQLNDKGFAEEAAKQLLLHLQLLQDPDWRLNAGAESAYLHDTLQSARQMLHKASTLTVTLATSDTAKVATVRVINHAGHKLPTGYPEGRQMWLNVRAFDAAGTLLYESGAYDPAAGQLQRDAEAKVYEIKQGITPEFAALLNKPAGASFHFVLNNTVVKDNRIPPQGYRRVLFDRQGLRPVGANYADGQHWDDTVYDLPPETERVAATLYYQTASREYVDFLRSRGGVDGLALGELWDSSKSPPVAMARAWAPSHDRYLPIIMQQR